MSFGIPESHLVRSDDDVRALNHRLMAERNFNGDNKTFVLKNLQYDPVHRLDLFKLPCQDETRLNDYLAKIAKDGNRITDDEPWQVQQFITGKEYACFVVLRNSKVDYRTSHAYIDDICRT